MAFRVIDGWGGTGWYHTCMPFTARDALRHTRKASTLKRRRQWAAIANNMLRSGASEGAAIRAANAGVRDSKAKTKAKRTRKRRSKK